MQSCLQEDHTQRPTFQQVLETLLAFREDLKARHDGVLLEEPMSPDARQPERRSDSAKTDSLDSEQQHRMDSVEVRCMGQAFLTQYLPN